MNKHIEALQITSDILMMRAKRLNDIIRIADLKNIQELLNSDLDDEMIKQVRNRLMYLLNN